MPTHPATFTPGTPATPEAGWRGFCRGSWAVRLSHMPAGESPLIQVAQCRQHTFLMPPILPYTVSMPLMLWPSSTSLLLSPCGGDTLAATKASQSTLAQKATW